MIADGIFSANNTNMFNKNNEKIRVQLINYDKLKNVLEVETKKKLDSKYDQQAKININGTLKKGDVGLLSFYTRMIKSKDNEYVTVEVVLQKKCVTIHQSS